MDVKILQAVSGRVSMNAKILQAVSGRVSMNAKVLQAVSGRVSMDEGSSEAEIAGIAHITADRRLGD